MGPNQAAATCFVVLAMAAFSWGAKITILNDVPAHFEVSAPRVLRVCGLFRPPFPLTRPSRERRLCPSRALTQLELAHGERC